MNKIFPPHFCPRPIVSFTIGRIEAPVKKYVMQNSAPSTELKTK
ncbi:hypothetical protein [Leptospira gomenensis]|nr:hypothetical protein [Leptospira gomenensis]